MARLYAVARSRGTRVTWTALELGQTLDRVPVIQANRLPDPLAPDAPMNTRSPAFLAMSPAGAVPVLEDDGLILSESLAICLYLARKAGGPIGPKDAAEDALMLQWGFFGATSVEAAAVAIMYVTTAGRAETPEGADEIAGHAARLARPFGVLETHLAAHGGHLVGGRFTVADILLAEMVRYAQTHAPLMAAHPAITAWLAAAQARPAFQTMWAERMAEPL